MVHLICRRKVLYFVRATGLPMPTPSCLMFRQSPHFCPKHLSPGHKTSTYILSEASENLAKDLLLLSVRALARLEFASLPSTVADEVLLRQLLLSAFRNAWTFMPCSLMSSSIFTFNSCSFRCLIDNSLISFSKNFMESLTSVTAIFFQMS